MVFRINEVNRFFRVERLQLWLFMNFFRRSIIFLGLASDITAPKSVQIGKGRRNPTVQPCRVLKIHKGVTSAIAPLRSMIEEAESRIILHINWSLNEGFNSFVMLSSDADVLVLVLHYLKSKARKSKELD